MTQPSSLAKRKGTDGSISPPPIKRKVQSGTTKSAVASFFTPSSQKPKDLTQWSVRSPNDDTPATLLVGRYALDEEGPNKRRKIAAFDLDSTLIRTASGKRHGNTASDWMWWDNQVPGRLRDLYEKEGYRIVILSNQAGLTLHFDKGFKGPKANAQKRVAEFKAKCSAIMNNLNLPVSVYAATEKDQYRKPRIGMWTEVCDDYDLEIDQVDLAESFFVGDAGGRIAILGDSQEGTAATVKDFSCSDRNFAQNLGIEYKTPEEFFLGEAPRDFSRDFDLADHPFCDVTSSPRFERGRDRDIVLFVGPPGAGKSTFYWNYLKPLGYDRVNQDILKSRDKCVQAAKDSLTQGNAVAVDNTNADPETRAVWISVAKNHNVPIRCVWFTTPLYLCEHNDAVRSLNSTLNPEDRQGLPKVAFTGFASRFKAPQKKEGFEELIEVPFAFRGTQEHYKLWGKYHL